MGDRSLRQGHVDCEVRDIENMGTRITKPLGDGGREIMKIRSTETLKARILRTKEARWHGDHGSQRHGDSGKQSNRNHEREGHGYHGS